MRFVRYLKIFSLLRGQEIKINYYTINVKMNFSLRFVMLIKFLKRARLAFVIISAYF